MKFKVIILKIFVKLNFFLILLMVGIFQKYPFSVESFYDYLFIW